MAPSQVIDTPTPGASVTAPVSLSGMASDNVGVASVTVAIHDNATGLWWNGTGWGAGVVRVPASVSGSGLLESWSYSFDPGITGSFWWAAQATDTVGNVGSQASSGFTISNDVVDPTQVIVAPLDGEIAVGGPVVLSGTASDNVEVAGVTVAINNSATGLWWNGTGWGAGVVRVPAVVSGSGTDVTWSYSFDPGITGSFWFAAQATDTSSNVGSQDSSVFYISSDAVAPSQVIDTPTPGASVTAPVSLSGMASDNVGVASVTVAIHDNATGLWWNGTGWGAVVVRVPASVSGSGLLESWSYSFDPGITGSFWWAAQATDVGRQPRFTSIVWVHHQYRCG